MATKPTKVTLSPRPSRLNPETFPALADSGLEYQATTLPDYTDAVADFVDEQADDALAAAVAAAAGSLDLAERETFAGYLVGIGGTTPFPLEPVEIVEYPELTQVQVEDDTSTVFGPVSGERLAQATAANVPDVLNASGSAPIFGCRAWVNFNGTGTVAIRGSGNVSSITDNGAGDYTVNFTTPMEDANYAVVASVEATIDTATPPVVVVVSRLAGSVRLNTGAAGAKTSLRDNLDVCVAIFR